MKNKNLIFAIFILGIVLMSSFAFATTYTGYFARKSLFGTRTTPMQVEIPDQVSKISATGTALTLDTLDVKTINTIAPNEKLNIGASTSKEIDIYATEEINEASGIIRLYVSDMLEVNGGNFGTFIPLIQILGGTNPATSGIYIYTPKIQFTKHTGTGNAYACLNSAGYLYRSATHCV